MIRYVKGDATEPIGDGPKVIVHCCNDVGAWGAGFVLALSRKWEAPENSYREWARRGRNRNPHTPHMAEPFELGRCQFVKVAGDITVCNLIGQEDIRPHDGMPPIRYDAIRSGFRSVREWCVRYAATVHMPRMGAGLAGGEWPKIEAIINDVMGDINVTVYDLDR